MGAVHLYELRNLYNDHTEKVVAWCEGTEEITRKGITALKDSLNGNRKEPEARHKEAANGEDRGHNRLRNQAGRKSRIKA